MKTVPLGTNSVVVITGASTGIGRATALEIARTGCQLVLVARQIEKLEEVALECGKFGALAVVESVDVADGEGVMALADAVLNRFGRIDVWINNAGVGVLGAFTDVPLQDHRRVIETNVIGTMNGAYAALRVFKKQHAGILINVASIASRLATPMLSSYVTSKFAIRGLSHAIRQDLMVEGFSGVHICQINPSVVDTPAFHHTANYSGKALRLKFPMASAEQVARRISKLIEKPRDEVAVGPLSSLGAFAYTLFPWLTANVLGWATKNFYFASGQKTSAALPKRPGNLYQPVKDEKAVDGGWKAGETQQV